MATVKLERVSLVHPMGDMGDRAIQGISTFIASSEWRMETDLYKGSIGDVAVYRNMNYPKPGEENWQWYAGIPTANIKTYRLADITAALEDGESKTQTQTNPDRSAGKASNAGRADVSRSEVGAASPRPGEVRT